MIETKQRILRLLRLVCYPNDHVKADNFLSGLSTNRLESKEAVEDLQRDGKIFVDSQSIYLIEERVDDRISMAS
jgi:hypothetical protein